jgi:hypothetical protein
MACALPSSLTGGIKYDEERPITPEPAAVAEPVIVAVEDEPQGFSDFS